MYDTVYPKINNSVLQLILIYTIVNFFFFFFFLPFFFFFFNFYYLFLFFVVVVHLCYLNAALQEKLKEHSSNGSGCSESV